MNDNFRERTHEWSHRLIHLIDSQSSPTSFKTYTTCISPEPTHYPWPAIVFNSQVKSSLSDGSNGINLISSKKKKRNANPMSAENKDNAYVKHQTN